MTMTMDHQQRQFGSLGYEHTQYSSPPQFTNPWSSTASTNTNSHLFPSNNTGYGSMVKQQPPRTTGVSMPYSSMSSSTSTLPPGTSYSNTAYGQPSLLGMSQDLLNPARSSYEQSYTSAPSSSMPSYAPTSAPYNYAHLLHPQLQQDRRLSQSYVLKVYATFPMTNDVPEAQLTPTYHMMRSTQEEAWLRCRKISQPQEISMVPGTIERNPIRMDFPRHILRRHRYPLRVATHITQNQLLLPLPTTVQVRNRWSLAADHADCQDHQVL